MSRILLEVCVDDAAGLDAAVKGGADRIELCSALSIGGLTPSPGLMALAAGAGVPVYAMIRPRPGNFIFGPVEIGIMRREIDAVRSAGLAGVVLGASLADGRLDGTALRLLVDHAAGLGLTLHRAFDLVPDVADAVDRAVDLGFERILTSGGAKRAPDAVDALSSILAQAGSRISIMPGSGITPDTIGSLLPQLAVHEIHSSCSVAEPAQDRRVVELGFAPEETRRTSEEIVRLMKDRLVAFQAL
ncbi:copper homeostasis protein CutC [Pararhizobium gei]|uniref:copper homeostasis protein CutC n=1 Tax=Pararhizobium gei TaxID=1395951 RepID=UPI0023DA5C67|nr:copper homeostasis protein CutC [Rhizobium gei]